MCVALSLIAVLAFVIAVLLLLHHKSKHSDPENRHNYLQDPYDQWFQVSDVCNFRTCSHEMWILFCLLVMVVCIVLSSQERCM